MMNNGKEGGLRLPWLKIMGMGMSNLYGMGLSPVLRMDSGEEFINRNEFRIKNEKVVEKK